MEDFYTFGASQEKKYFKNHRWNLKNLQIPCATLSENKFSKMDVKWISQNKSKPLPLFLAEFFVDED